MRPRANQLSWQMSLRNRHESAQPRLGSQQIVITRIAPSLADVVPYRQQMTTRVEKEVKLHCGKLVGLKRQPFEGRYPVSGSLACQRDETPQFTQPLFAQPFALIAGGGRRVRADPLFDRRWQLQFKSREVAQRRDLIDAGKSAGSIVGG